MSSELQRLWRAQPLDADGVQPRREEQGDGTDFAAPTAQRLDADFEAVRPRREQGDGTDLAAPTARRQGTDSEAGSRREQGDGAPTVQRVGTDFEGVRPRREQGDGTDLAAPRAPRPDTDSVAVHPRREQGDGTDLATPPAPRPDTDSVAVHPRRGARGDGEHFTAPTAQLVPPRRWRRRAAFALAAALALLLAGVISRTRAPDSEPPPAFPAAVSVDDEVETALAECRTWANAETSAPDWDRAVGACARALELAPGHRGALLLVRRISTLRSCEATYNAAVDAEAAQKADLALETYTRVRKDCEVYLVRSAARVRALLPGAINRAALSCGGDVACEAVARLACHQDGFGSDPRFAAFLSTRPAWRCPDWAAFHAAPPPEPGRSAAREALRKRFPAPALAEAVVLYFEGDLQRARAGLAAVVRDSPAYAARAHALDAAIEEVMRLLAQIALELKRPTPSWAALEQAVTQALDADAQILLGDELASLSPDERKRALRELESHVRRSVISDVARGAYERGRALADRQDFRGACQVWKVGGSFSRGELDLLKALTNVCTRKAAAALEVAHTCADLRLVLDYAVDGDGYRERVADQLAEAGCP